MKCICQICICGGHHCPRRASGLYDKHVKCNMISEYTDKYLAHHHQPKDSYKPKDVYQKSPIEMECVSTFRSDYVPHMAFHRKPKLCSKYETNKECMDMNTIYKQDYRPHPLRPSVAYRPHQYRQPCRDKMDVISTYQGDYQLWNFSKRPSMRRTNTYHPPKEKFDMKSTFQDHFHYLPIKSTPSCKPLQVYRGSVAPLNYTTNYRIDYVPYHIERIQIQKKEKYNPNQDPFDCLTTNHQDYKGLPGKAATSLKPRYCLTDSEIPFSSLTEFQDKYQIWSLSPRFKKKSLAYKKPSDKMDFISTTQNDYIPHILQPQLSCKPVQQYYKCSKYFEARSTMSQDFKPWQCKRASPIKPQLNLGLPVGSFEDTTTARHDYVPYPLSPIVSFKPVNKRCMPLTPMDAQTIYSLSYTPKPVQICPASYKNLPGYVYLKTDSLGHKQYKLQSEK
ncbi:stabilizer of axonemal microtubules 1 isoform X2 [Engystomops pustulosus]|uniref:stabilizer of axonemal microtubules 1 isoform X2 n=1 Tax=Engystomops pustulosus TaxID=76066 RepID=UPI003AFA69A4